jgi:hypothetical protein
MLRINQTHYEKRISAFEACDKPITIHDAVRILVASRILTASKIVIDLSCLKVTNSLDAGG